MKFLNKADQAANLEGKLLRLNLQTFADEVPPGDNPPADTPPSDTPPVDTQPTKTFTQDDVNSVAAKEAKKAQEKLLKQLGITDFENAKEGMKKFQEWQESQKTEAQKQMERLQELETNFQSAQEAKSNLEMQVAVLSAGVVKDYAQDVAALAKNYMTEEVDINQAVQMVVDKYPHFTGEQKQDTPPKPSFGQTQYQKQEPTQQEIWEQAFGIKK